MEIEGVSSGDDNGDDLARLVTLTELKHELWEKLANCEDEELRTQLFDQLSAYREELARLREIVSRGLDEPEAASPSPPPFRRSVGEELRSSLLLPPEESTSPFPSRAPRDPQESLSAPNHAAAAVPDEAPGRGHHPHPEPPATPVSSSLPPPHLSSSRSSRSRLSPLAATLIAVAALALIAWVAFLGSDGASNPLDGSTSTTVSATSDSAVGQIRAVLDGLGYGSIVIEERDGTIYLGGVVASESERNAVVGASQALTRGMPLDSSALMIVSIDTATSHEVVAGDDETPVVTPIDDGPYIVATLDGKDFVLTGVVPSTDLAGEYLRAAEVAYAPYVRSDLAVDGKLESADWLSSGPTAITLLPMIIDGQIVMSGEGVQLSGRAPDEAGVERIQGALGQVTGLPVVVQDVEVLNLDAPTYVIAADEGFVELEGRIPSDEIRALLVGGALEAYGEGNVDDRITVDPGVYPSLWMYSAGPLMQAMSTFPDYELRIDGTAFSGFINGGVTFESNSAVFSGNYAEVLDVGVGVLTRDPSLQLVIEGHTDNLGSDAANLALSQARAEAVRDYFISNGIDASRLIAIGIGEAEPVVSNDTAEGRARNRRIQYILSTSS